MRKIARGFLLVIVLGIAGWIALTAYDGSKSRKDLPYQKRFYFSGDPAAIHDGDQLVVLRNQQSDVRVSLSLKKGWNPAQTVKIVFGTERRTIGTETLRFPYWRQSWVFNKKLLDPDSFLKITFRFDEKQTGPVRITKSEVRGNQANPKILVFGLDGASLRILQPLIQNGKCPNFKTLIDQGSYGDLRSEEPTYSPVIWTTLAAGRGPDAHGITFYLAKSGLPVTSDAVKTKRFWEILSEYSRLTSAVLGWYITWPVEEFNGVMIADRAYYSFKARDLSYPPGIFDKDYQQIHLAANKDMPERLRRFTSFSYDWDWKKKFGQGSLERQVSSIVHQRLMHVYRRDRSFAEFGLKINETLNPDVLAVYLRGADFTSHGFWKFRAPSEVPFLTVSKQEQQWFGDVIDRYYVYLDELLGRYLKQLGENATVFVISDHGFQAVSETEGKDPELSGTHELNGILFCKGPPFRKGYRIQDASIYDFLPTLLAVAGLPQASDMPGHVLTEAMNPEFLSKNPLKRIKTYGAPKGIRQEKSNRNLDEEIKQELRSLGYIQ